MSSISTSILMSISSILGVASVPESGLDDWGGARTWERVGERQKFTASSVTIPALCRSNPSFAVHFPIVIHGFHEFFIDGKSVRRFGDPQFKNVRSFYGKPQIDCKQFANGTELRWEVTSYSAYFARIPSLPKVKEPSRFYNIFAEDLNALVGGMLLVLGAFACVVSWKKVPMRMLASFALATFVLPFYFVFTVPEIFGIKGTMFTLHKLADLSLWVGTIGVFWFFYEQRVIKTLLFKLFLGFAGTAIVVILFSKDSDTTQVGTTLPFLIAPIVLSSAIVNLLLAHKHGEKFSLTLVKTIEIAFLSIAAMSDILFVVGIHEGPPIFSLGILGILFFAAISLNQIVNETYKERDYLRGNLQKEVANKTASLGKALEELKVAQAEIISSAKLASLGTLSAGIAHEINNSLNFVRGSIGPLSSILKNDLISQSDRKKAEKLMSIMTDGLRLTEQIIINLKTYSSATGTTSHQELKPIVDNVLAMLQGKVRNRVSVEVDIPNDFSVLLDPVCITQVLSNLVDNACDAMEANTFERNLKISAGKTEGCWFLSVSDNGAGIPDHIRTQIFDPFFTTKTIGKGTGLGLYIVRSELAKRGGKIEAQSLPGKGTTMVLHFVERLEGEAA